MEGKKFSYKGEFHQIEDAALLPKSDTGTPPILIGTLKGKPRMSRLVAEFADMWNCMIAFGNCNVSTYDDSWSPIHDACVRCDRDWVELPPSPPTFGGCGPLRPCAYCIQYILQGPGVGNPCPFCARQ